MLSSHAGNRFCRNDSLEQIDFSTTFFELLACL